MGKHSTAFQMENGTHVPAFVCDHNDDNIFCIYNLRAGNKMFAEYKKGFNFRHSSE
jgi:hypothetical protein